MLVYLLFVIASSAAVPLLAVDVSGVPTTLFIEGNINGRVKAVNASASVTFSCFPDISLLGTVRLNPTTGQLTGVIWVVGHFGPFNFIVSDSLGNMAVSEPVIISVTVVETAHFHAKFQCEQNLPCFIAPKYAALHPMKEFVGSGQPPDGMRFNSKDGSYRGIVRASVGRYVVFTLIVFQSGLRVNNSLTVQVVAPLKLDASFLQTTCGKILFVHFFSHSRKIWGSIFLRVSHGLEGQKSIQA